MITLLVLVDDPGLVSAVCDIDEADEQGDLIVLIQGVPDAVCEGIDVRCEFLVEINYRRLACEAGQGIAVAVIGMDKSAFAGQRILKSEGITQAGGRIASLFRMDMA